MDDAILARLDRLERENRRWKAGGTAALVALAAVVLLGQSVPEGKAIEATSVVVREAGGKRAIRLGSGKEGTFGFALEDGSGKALAGVRFRKDGDAEVVLADPDGMVRVQAASFGKDLAGIVLSDGKGSRRSWWMAAKSDPILDFFDGKGQTRLGLSHIAESDSAGISFFNAAGATRAGLVQNRDDSMRLTFRTGPREAEKKVAELRIAPDGTANLQFNDPGERVFSIFGAMPPPRGGQGSYVGTKDGKMGVALMGYATGSVLQLGDLTGAKLAEIHTLSEEGTPPEARGKVAPGSLILFDRRGKETFRAPETK